VYLFRLRRRLLQQGAGLSERVRIRCSIASPFSHLAGALVRLELPVSARGAVDVDLHALLVKVGLPAATVLGLIDALDALEEEHDLLVWTLARHSYLAGSHFGVERLKDPVARARAAQEPLQQIATETTTKADEL
jgi:hypothetical protein